MEKERLRESRSNVAPRDGLEGSTLYCTWRGNWFFFLESNTLPSSSIGGGGGLTVAGAGRFPVFSSESLLKVGKRLCGKAHIVHKRKPPLSGGVVGGWWRGRPGTTQTTQPISFVFCNHDAQ